MAFPELTDPEESTKLRTTATALAEKLCKAVVEHLQSLEATPELIPSATSIGVACYLTSHLVGQTLDHEGRTQVAQGLAAAALVNDDSVNGLTTLPPTERPN